MAIRIQRNIIGVKDAAYEKIKFAPGIDKQDTSVGAEGRWVDSDNVRFRYGLPEKVGGWQSLLTDTIVGVAENNTHLLIQMEIDTWPLVQINFYLYILKSTI